MSDYEQRLDQAIADYLAACDAGTPPDRETFLAQHAELAPHLAVFLDDHHRMKQAVPATANDVTLTVNLGAEPRPTLPTNVGVVPYFGDYELLAEIARGGMGVVYRARQVSLNRVVALKMILAGHLASDDDVRRFRQEAESAASLDHPNILPIYEVSSYQGQQYFSMKLVDGGSLAACIAQLPSKPQRAIALLLKIAHAVHFAHQRGILHRDLKPANILLDTDDTPYITDFGLAKKTDVEDSGLTRTGAIVGTPSYMAPEQARGAKGITTAADVYALGAILYEMLTGQAPFRGPSIAQTLRMVEEQEPPPPASLNPTCDPDLAAIALKCLEKQPAARYESAGALATDLAHWQRGEPVTARRATRFRRVKKWFLRNPVVASLSAALVLVLVVGSLTSVLYAIKARTNEREAQANATKAAESAKQATATAAAAKILWYRGVYDQVRALRLAQRPGWRRSSLQLIQEAATARLDVEAVATPESALPTLPDWRSEAVMALIDRDAEMIRELPVNPGLPTIFSTNGRYHFTRHFNADPNKTTYTLVDLRTGTNVDLGPTNPETNQERSNLALAIDSLSADATIGICRSGVDSVALRDIRTGVVRHLLKAPATAPPHSGLHRTQLTLDNQRALAVRANGAQAEVLMWDVQRPNEPSVLMQMPYQPKKEGIDTSLYSEHKLFSGLRFAPDGKHVGCVTADRKAYRVFETSTQPATIVANIPLHGDWVNVAWHPKELIVALVGSKDGVQRLSMWRVGAAEPYAVVEGNIDARSEANFASLAFSPEGGWLAVPNAHATSVHLVAVADGVLQMLLADLCSLRVGHIGWLSENELTTYGIMESLRTWRLSTDQAQTVFPRLYPQRLPVFSADARWLAVNAGQPTSNSSTNDQVDRLTMRMQVPTEKVVLVDRRTRRIAHTHKGFMSAATSELCIDPNSERIATLSNEEILVRTIATGQEVMRHTLPKNVGARRWKGATFLADGRLMGIFEYVKTQGPQIGYWDIDRNQALDADLFTNHNTMNSLRLVAPGGTHALLSPPMYQPNPTSNAKYQLLDMPSGKLLHEFTLHDPSGKPPTLTPPLKNFTMAVRLAPQAKRVLSLSTDMDLAISFQEQAITWIVHDLPSGLTRFRTPIKGFAENACAFANGSAYLVLGGSNGYVDVWDIDTQRLLFRWQPHRGRKVDYIAAAADGDLATTASDDDTLSVLHFADVERGLRALGLGW